MTGHPVHPTPDPPSPSAPDAKATDATGGVIPYKNSSALIGYYCGVFSLIPFLGLLLGPIALVLGIMGWKAYRREPHRRGQAHAWVAIILGGLSGAAHLALLFGSILSAF